MECTDDTELLLRQRLQEVDWTVVRSALDAQGHAIVRSVLQRAECEELARLYDEEEGFRSRVVMARHGFGQGEYRYFAYPLPPLVAQLRTVLYPQLAPIANDWHERMGLEARFPATHAEYIRRCHAAGQAKPTPLLLRYGKGDYNCLHQDLYGEHVFPLQAIALLSRPGAEFTGGELVMTEQRPRMQSRAMVLALAQGDLAIIAVHQRPLRGARGDYRVNLRHGVSMVHGGQRHTLGVIFHDAR